MKLILENWKKFLKEEQIQEATEQEISYIEDLMDTPVSKLPFNNIFGDRYRIIEELPVLDPESPLKSTMDALSKMGWDVGSPSNIKYDEKGRISGKVLCTKTKVTYYIDKNGKEGVSKKAVTLNLPKLLSGINNFIENSYKPLRDQHFEKFNETFSRFVKRGYDNPKPEDEKYTFPGGYFAKGTDTDRFKVNKQDYMELIKFINASNYWLGLTPESGAWAHADGIQKFYEINKIDIDKFKEFTNYINDRFQDFLENAGEYYQNYFIIYSRHPIDVFRMSDHEGLGSCHSLPSEKGGDWDEYNICALAEAYGNGMIAYVVPKSEFDDKGVDPTVDELDEMDEKEIFADETRGIDGLVPSSRIRIKHTSYHGAEDPIRLAIPEKRIYGTNVPGLKSKVNTRLANSQKAEIEKISEAGQIIDLAEFTRYGGQYQDNDIEQLVPQLFRKAGKDISFYGYVNYDEDLQNSMYQKVGKNSRADMEEKLSEIFEGHTGGMVSFRYNVEEDWDSSLYYNWDMFITFSFARPEGLTSEKISNIRDQIQETVEESFPTYYRLPTEVEVDVEVADKIQVIITYYHHNLSQDSHIIDELDEELQRIMHSDPNISSVFDYYAEDGAMQLVMYELEKNGLIPSDDFQIDSTIEKYGLEDGRSWWDLVDREVREHDYFGDEVTIGASFQEDSGFYPDEIIEEVPEELKGPAIVAMTQFVNMLQNNWKFSTEITFGKEYEKGMPPITIMAKEFIIGPKLTAERMKEMVEDEEELEITMATSMTEDMPLYALENVAKFLVDKSASQDRMDDTIISKMKEYIANAIKKQISENKKRIKVKIIR